jgi:hypothetical protein
MPNLLEDQNSIIKFLVEFLCRRLNLHQSAVDVVCERQKSSSNQTNEDDIEFIEELLKREENIKTYQLTKRFFKWKFSLICFVFTLMNSIIR